MANTRSSSEAWLIGRGRDQLSGSHMPTNGDALRLMMFFHIDQKLTLKEAASICVSRAGSEQEFHIRELNPGFESNLKSQPKWPQINILNDPGVAGALDRVNVPDRGATYIVGAVAKALGHDVTTLTLSRSAIRRSCCKICAEQAAVSEEWISSVALGQKTSAWHYW